MNSQSQEDYLRAVYYFYENKGHNVSSVDVSKYLGVSKAAVSRMLKKLSWQNFLKIKPYSQISFTKKGLCFAKKLTYKHRVIEVFLQDCLKIKNSLVHEEAHKLEHAFSDKTAEKLFIFLKKPKFCPGGKKIKL